MRVLAGAGLRMQRAGTMLIRRARGCLLALAPAVVPGCYYYVPMQSAPAPGVAVEVQLNDTGRVGMASAVGPEAGSIQGVVASNTDTGFVVLVSKVLGEYGGVAKWEGEAVSIRPEYVRSMRERKFSKARTALVAIVATAGFVAFAASRNLLGLGGAASSSDSTGGGGAKNQ